MFSGIIRHLKLFDWGILALVVLLLIFGLVVQYGLSSAVNSSALSNATKQLIFALVGLLMIFIISQIDFRALKPVAYLLYIVTLVLLVVVLFIGQTFHGVKGWLSFGIFNFQLVELVKISSIIVLAIFWQKKVRPLLFSKIIISFLIIAPSIILVILQPDFGSALILFSLWLGPVMIVDKNIKHLLIIFITLILALILIFMFLFKNYQRERVMTYFNPNHDPLGRGYQIAQATAAIGSGKIFGYGLSFGTHGQLRFLPASQTDFIFAVIAEEMGLVGCSIIFIIFFLIFRQLNRIAQKTYDSFGALLVIGILINLFIQFFLNIGMNLGLLPIIGIPLPFLSYGGSSLIISLISVGLVESIVIHRITTPTAQEL